MIESTPCSTNVSSSSSEEASSSPGSRFLAGEELVEVLLRAVAVAHLREVVLVELCAALKVA
jgi:hypothetical protein